MGTDDNIVKLAALAAPPAEPSEDALALLFAEHYSDTLRYTALWNRWLQFNGSIWKSDETLHVYDMVRELCRDAELKQSAQTAKTVAAVEKLARSDRRLAATADQWDAAPMRLTTGNMTFDLHSGDSTNADPLDYITKQAGCAAAPPGTPCTLWAAFLDRVLAGDDELQKFLQRYIGYCLTGCTDEHCFLFLYGTGANGKSTFVNAIARVFGDYCTNASMDTFLASNSPQHPTDLAKLHGARLVTAQETQKGRRWDEIKIKALTGGDRISARFMRADFFDYVPTFKLLIAGNHRPRLSHVDEAMRRRLMLVPFTVQIPLLERDTDLPHKLEAEHPAILRWAIDGCLQWQNKGLSPPARVIDATGDYFTDKDTLGQWLAECTEKRDPPLYIRAATLFGSWKAWCEERNHRPGSIKTFSEELGDRGYTPKREPGTGQRGFDDVALKTRGV
jgi:putative DNA primase/helicase